MGISGYKIFMITDFSSAKFGRYELQERIGRGGMAQVFKAFDTNLKRTVAVKVLHDYLSDDPTFKERFEREAEFVASFNHPNIIQIYDSDSVELNGQRLYYMVMPYIPGNTLRDELERYAQKDQLMPRERVLQIAVNLSDALAYAHKGGMVHRDVKPGNILFDERGRAILTDFGIARLVVSSSLTQEGIAVGTPAYMSPEQAAGEPVDARSDIYALGIILYEMLTGKPPFHDDGSISILFKHLNEPVPSLSKFIVVPYPAMDAVIMKALAKEPEGRYQTAESFAADLSKAFGGGHIDTPTSITNSYKGYGFKPEASPERQTRLTQTLEQVSVQIRTVTRSPAGILIAGLLITAVLVGITLVNRAMIQTEALSMTGDDADSMVGSVENRYFSSDFSPEDPSRTLWMTGEDGLVTRQFEDEGAYRFVNRRSSRAVTSIVEGGYRYTDVTLSIEASLQPESNQASGYGIIFRYQDEDNYNVFAVDGMGRYSIWVRSAGVWRELRDAGEAWTRNNRVALIGEVNNLTIDVIGSRFIGYINSELIVDVTDDTLSSGGIGIYLASTDAPDAQAALHVTHYSVRDIAESMTNSMTGSEDGSPARDLR